MKTPQFTLHAQMEERHWWFQGRRKIVREMVRCVLPPDKEKTVLDIGCGTGGNIAAFADDYRCIGIDPSPDAIRLAQTRFPQARFVQSAIPDGIGPLISTANLLLLMDVLEHVPDDSLFFSELLAQAKPGSYLLITVPADMTLWSQHDVSFGHHRRYDPDQLQRLWAHLPVKTLLLSYYNARLHPLIRMVRNLNQRKGKASGEAGTDFKLPSQPVNQLLKTIFASEGRTLVELLKGRRSQGFRQGVSLIALLRREG